MSKHFRSDGGTTGSIIERGVNYIDASSSVSHPTYKPLCYRRIPATCITMTSASFRRGPHGSALSSKLPLSALSQQTPLLAIMSDRPESEKTIEAAAGYCSSSRGLWSQPPIWLPLSQYITTTTSNGIVAVRSGLGSVPSEFSFLVFTYKTDRCVRTAKAEMRIPSERHRTYRDDTTSSAFSVLLFFLPPSTQ